MKTEINEKRLTELESKADKAVASAESLTITNDKEMAQAGEMLSVLNKRKDAIVADKETFTKPLNKVLNDIRKRYKPAEKKLDGAIKVLRSAMGTYQTEKEAEAETKEAKVLDRVGSGRGKLGIEAAANQIAAIDRPDAKVETDSGSVSFRDDYEITVTDIRIIPEEYLTVDLTAIKKVVKDGGVVDGVAVKKIKVPVNRR